MQPNKTDRDEVLRLCDEVGIDFNSFYSENGKKSCMCNGSQEIEKFTKLIELVKAEEQDAIVALINDDGAAISYQSLAQYRSALLQAIRARKDK